jgi:hypothetical protein
MVMLKNALSCFCDEEESTERPRVEETGVG